MCTNVPVMPKAGSGVLKVCICNEHNEDRTSEMCCSHMVAAVVCCAAALDSSLWVTVLANNKFTKELIMLNHVLSNLQIILSQQRPFSWWLHTSSKQANYYLQKRSNALLWFDWTLIWRFKKNTYHKTRCRHYFFPQAFLKIFTDLLKICRTGSIQILELG